MNLKPVRISRACSRRHLPKGGLCNAGIRLQLRALPAREPRNGDYTGCFRFYMRRSPWSRFCASWGIHSGTRRSGTERRCSGSWGHSLPPGLAWRCHGHSSGVRPQFLAPSICSSFQGIVGFAFSTSRGEDAVCSSRRDMPLTQTCGKFHCGPERFVRQVLRCWTMIPVVAGLRRGSSMATPCPVARRATTRGPRSGPPSMPSLPGRRQRRERCVPPTGRTCSWEWSAVGKLR